MPNETTVAGREEPPDPSRDINELCAQARLGAAIIAGWGFGWAFGRSGTPIAREQYPDWIDADEFERGIRDGEKEAPFIRG